MNSFNVECNKTFFCRPSKLHAKKNDVTCLFVNIEECTQCCLKWLKSNAIGLHWNWDSSLYVGYLNCNKTRCEFCGRSKVIVQSSMVQCSTPKWSDACISRTPRFSSNISRYSRKYYEGVVVGHILWHKSAVIHCMDTCHILSYFARYNCPLLIVPVLLDAAPINVSFHACWIIL